MELPLKEVENGFVRAIKPLGWTAKEFHEYMDLLAELAVIMKDKKEGGLGGGYAVERYCGICNVSDLGHDCAYAQKAGMLFVADGLHVKIDNWVKRMVEWHGKNRDPNRGGGQASRQQGS